MRICGMDEVGRGSLAGPLVACGTVITNSKFKALSSKQFLKDSKKLNSVQREKMYRELMAAGVEYRLEIISARQINNRGMGWANKEIFRRLARKVEADKYIVDGNLKIAIRGRRGKIKSVIGADKTRKCVMAASIIAKVTRDRMMRNLHREHAVYGWDRNAGYGTADHIAAIRRHGTVRYHRDVWITTVLRNQGL